MIDIIQFGNELVSSTKRSQASIVYRDGDIWHKLYVTPTTHTITKKVYTNLYILEKIQNLDILKNVIIDYYVIGKDQGIYIKQNHQHSNIEAFSSEHKLCYGNLENFCLSYLDKHYYHTLQSAPFRFNDFTDTNIFIQDDMSWRNVDIESYFNTRYFPPIEYFANSTWTKMMQLFKNDKDIATAKQVFKDFYNEKRLNTIEQQYTNTQNSW